MTDGEVAGLEACIIEFSIIDPISMAFRYHVDTHDNPSLPSDLEYINIRNLAKIIAKIDSFLDAVYMTISVSLDQKYEMEAAFRDYYPSKAGLTAIITVLGLILTWLFGLKFTTQWNIRQKQRELDLSAAEQFRNLYGEFLTVWRLWDAARKDDSQKDRMRWELLTRACDAEGKVESLLMKLSIERYLTPKDIKDLGEFRQGYQLLREFIRDTHSWGSSEFRNTYETFKYLSCQVGAMIFSNDQRRPPSPEAASKALDELMLSYDCRPWRARYADSYRSRPRVLTLLTNFMFIESFSFYYIKERTTMTRRGNGDGSIYRRKSDGKWVAYRSFATLPGGFSRLFERRMKKANEVGSSVAQDRQVEQAEARGVGDHVDLGDLPACDRETEDEEQLSTRGHDDSYGSVHEHRLCFPGTSGELPGHGQRTTDLPRRALR